MALGSNYYITIPELKGHIQAADGAVFTDADDKNLEFAIRASCEWLEDWFDTTFYARTETRYFSPEHADLLYTDDLLTVTTLKTDTTGNGSFDTTWATSDYILEPRNAQNGRKPKPYRQIRISRNGDYAFPVFNYSTEITGTWGYCTIDNIPSGIQQFVLLMSHRLWKRKDAIFGIAGAPQLNVQVIQARITKDDDLMQLLQGIDRRGFYND